MTTIDSTARPMVHQLPARLSEYDPPAPSHRAQHFADSRRDRDQHILRTNGEDRTSRRICGACRVALRLCPHERSVRHDTEAIAKAIAKAIATESQLRGHQLLSRHRGVHRSRTSRDCGFPATGNAHRGTRAFGVRQAGNRTDRRTGTTPSEGLSNRRDHAATIRVAQCQRRLLRDSLAPESAKAGTA